jgi:predicted amidohydrolase
MYHKINLTSSETVYFDRGTSPLTFPLKDITFGVLICRDQNDAMLTRKYKTVGDDALVILAAYFYESREAIQYRSSIRLEPC